MQSASLTRRDPRPRDRHGPPGQACPGSCVSPTLRARVPCLRGGGGRRAAAYLSGPGRASLVLVSWDAGPSTPGRRPRTCSRGSRAYYASEGPRKRERARPQALAPGGASACMCLARWWLTGEGVADTDSKSQQGWIRPKDARHDPIFWPLLTFNQFSRGGDFLPSYAVARRTQLCPRPAPV